MDLCKGVGRNFSGGGAEFFGPPADCEAGSAKRTRARPTAVLGVGAGGGRPLPPRGSGGGNPRENFEDLHAKSCILVQSGLRKWAVYEGIMV